MKPLPDTLESRLQAARENRVDQHRVRRRRVLTPQAGMRVRLGNRLLHNFCSNDYLGLALEQATGMAGSGASPLVCGHHESHHRLETALAHWLKRESVVLFSSGFLANLAVATALTGRGDTIVQDHRCHASLIDAARLSGAHLKRYPHGNVEAARARLEAVEEGLVLLVTDGVFSMDGDAATLGLLADAAKANEATLVVDDAHGIGVLGDSGAGLCELLSLGSAAVPVLVGTLGKAFGAAGAFVAGDKDLIQHLENEGRSLIYSTALPPVVVEAAYRSLERIRTESWRRETLAQHVHRFREGAAARGLELLPSSTPIQPLLLESEQRTLMASELLEAQGFLVTAIRPPTVPVGACRLRITLSAGHETAQIDGLLNALEQTMSQLSSTAGAVS